jgi:hypothetical protein
MTTGTYLLVDGNGLVENVIYYNPANPLVLPTGYQLVAYAEQAWIGWTLNPDGTFNEPTPEPAP